MADWKELEKDVKNWLKTRVSEGIEYRVGLGYRGFKSDGILAKDRKLIAIEIEVGQTHPDTNVAKYWLLHERGEKKYKKIILLHFFTPGYKRGPGRKELAEFLGERILNTVPSMRYMMTDLIRYKDYERAFRKIRSVVKETVKDEF